MKAKDNSEKESIKLKYATALHHFLKNSKFGSLRKLATDSGMEYAHLQRVFSGKVDVSFTTSISVLEALEISPSDFFAVYDAVTEKRVKEFVLYLENQKREGKRKIVNKD